MNRSYGQVAYEAHRADTTRPGLLLEWADLDQRIRDHWEVIGATVVRAVRVDR